MKTFLYTVD